VTSKREAATEKNTMCWYGTGKWGNTTHCFTSSLTHSPWKFWSAPALLVLLYCSLLGGRKQVLTLAVSRGRFQSKFYHTFNMPPFCEYTSNCSRLLAVAGNWGKWPRGVVSKALWWEAQTWNEWWHKFPFFFLVMVHVISTFKWICSTLRRS
jgi:hypothetical protein